MESTDDNMISGGAAAVAGRGRLRPVPRRNRPLIARRSTMFSLAQSCGSNLARFALAGAVWQKKKMLKNRKTKLKSLLESTKVPKNKAETNLNKAEFRAFSASTVSSKCFRISKRPSDEEGQGQNKAETKLDLGLQIFPAPEPAQMESAGNSKMYERTQYVAESKGDEFLESNRLLNINNLTCFIPIGC